MLCVSFLWLCPTSPRSQSWTSLEIASPVCLQKWERCTSKWTEKKCQSEPERVLGDLLVPQRCPSGVLISAEASAQINPSILNEQLAAYQARPDTADISCRWPQSWVTLMLPLQNRVKRSPKYRVLIYIIYLKNSRFRNSRCSQNTCIQTWLSPFYLKHKHQLTDT